MGTFTQDNKSTATKQADASKTDAKAGEGQKVEKVDTGESKPEDAPVGGHPDKTEVVQPTKEVDPAHPNTPEPIVDESEDEKADRHEASAELGVQEVTDPASQSDSELALEAGTKVVPGAAAGPDVAGVVRNDDGNVAYAPPGTLNAAMNGVQEDASGHVSSIHTDNGTASGVRV